MSECIAEYRFSWREWLEGKRIDVAKVYFDGIVPQSFSVDRDAVSFWAADGQSGKVSCHVWTKSGRYAERTMLIKEGSFV